MTDERWTLRGRGPDYRPDIEGPYLPLNEYRTVVPEQPKVTRHHITQGGNVIPIGGHDDHCTCWDCLDVRGKDDDGRA